MYRCSFMAMALLATSSCAFPRQVQRIGIEYNGAVAGMANELTLLNIARAREEMPLHYTSVGRLSGSLTIRANGSINVPIRGAQSLITTGGTTSNAPAGLTTGTSLTEAVTEGLEVFTPSLTGEISSGPSFDIAILDSQEFYQGVMASIPFMTIDNFVNQGFDNQLLLHLLIERIEFKAQKAEHGYAEGEVVKTLLNRPGESGIMDFVNEVGCLRLSSASTRREPAAIAPVSRITRAEDGSTRPFTIEELALADGQNFQFSEPLGVDSATDGRIILSRVFPERRVPRLIEQTVCPIQPAARANRAASSSALSEGDQAQPRPPARDLTILPYVAPSADRPEQAYAGIAEIALRDERGGYRRDGNGNIIRIKTVIDITFRSPEGVIRHVGAYLRAFQADPDRAYLVNDAPLFELGSGSGAGAVVSTDLLGQRYFIADDQYRRRNMSVIAIIQQLINLHKRSADRPTTVPVRAVP